MGESLTEGRVAVSSVVGGVRIGLVGGAAGSSALDTLAVANRELGVQVNAEPNDAEVPRGALASVCGTKVSVTVLRNNHTGGDTGVSADKAWVDE